MRHDIVHNSINTVYGFLFLLCIMLTSSKNSHFFISKYSHVVRFIINHLLLYPCGTSNDMHKDVFVGSRSNQPQIKSALDQIV